MKQLRYVILLPLISLSLLGLSATTSVSANSDVGTWETFQNAPTFNPGSMVLLTDGSVLMADHGANQTGSSNWWILKPDSFGNYSDGTWSQTASMQSGYAPDNKGGGLISDGRVVVVGGDRNGSNVWVGTNQGAIYDPISKVWSPLTPPNNGSGEFASIADAPSVVLPDGRFMFGPSGNGDHGAQNQKQIAILDSASLTWTVGGTGRIGANPEAGFTTLPNGKILTISTVVPSNQDTEIFDPSSMTWISAGKTPSSLVDPATANGGTIGEIGPSILMPSGKVFAEGSTKSTAVYDVQTGTWSSGPDMPIIGGVQYVVADGPSTILPNGDVLFTASPIGDGVPPTHFFTFDGTKITQVADAPASTSVSRVPSFSGSFLPLPNGQILFNNRMGPAGLALYNPGVTADSNWLPKITDVPSTLSVGTTYTVSGKQLSGRTSGAAFGDDWGTTSNYPVVQITNLATGKVSYAATKNIGTYAVTPNLSGSTTFTLSSEAIDGPAKLRVISGLFASSPVAVTVTGGLAAPVVATPKPVAKTTISCRKGTTIRKISAIRPKCPTGFKKQ